MAAQSKIADRIRSMVRDHDRKVAGEAILKLLIGLVFTAMTFVMVFGFLYIGVGAFVAQFGISGLKFAMWSTLVFVLVSVGSAWYRVNPMSGLRRLTDEEYFLTIASLKIDELCYFSPRHATAGAAMILIGGPATILEALGMWTNRFGASSACIGEAATMLASCEDPMPIESIRNREAAILLRRLALVKFVPRGHSMGMTLTEKGSKAAPTKRVKS